MFGYMVGDRRGYRDLWLLVVTIFVAVALVKQGDTLSQVREGRRQAVSVNCAATAAVIDAGRQIITGQTSGSFSEKFEANLRRLGYPPRRVREAQARRAAESYSAAISRRIERVSGVSGLVRPDGSLNCARVQRLSKTG